MKNWKYKVINENGDVIKDVIYDSPLTASQVCRHLELEGYEVLSISCIETFPLFNFNIPKKERAFYA